MNTGLTSNEVSSLLNKYGYNKIPEKKSSLYAKILKNVISPIALMLITASTLSFFLKKDFDGYFILILLVINISITLWQENKADNAIKKLNENLEQKIKVFRDGKWQYISSQLIVPGDTLQLSLGEVIPADGKIIEANHVSINESALTGESLPKEKNVNDNVYSGSFIASGLVTIQVTATGVKTNFGKTLFSVERVIKNSLLEKDIINISKFLSVLSILAVIMLTISFLLKKAPLLELMTLDLSLVIAGIPISLPTVMTLIIEFGVLNLAKKKVIIRRLSALEDLANVNLLLTDKTGTLTKNKIVVSDIYAYDGFTHNDVLLYSSLVASLESDNPIDKAILEKTNEVHLQIPVFEKVDFVPADSERKRSSVTIKKDGKRQTVTLGAPQIVAKFCDFDDATNKKFTKEVETLAANGYRTLAIAITNGLSEKKMKIVGLIALSDTLRNDAKNVIEYLKQNGLAVAMVTGDNKAIAKNIAKELNLNDRIVTKEELDDLKPDAINMRFFNDVGSFAEILPEDKFRLVQEAKKYYVVASNGDGVNDLPAVKAANVGIAVKNAVTALKATADIVLLTEGISVIRDAIIESRKIFSRIYTYSLYRISESLRLIITIAILGMIYGVYPMTALQIILIALLNDIPIISLASDNVKITNRPAKINIKKRFVLSSLYGIVGVTNSLILFFLVQDIFHLSWPVIQTMYFLKLTISGHMLIYIAHTKERWWKFLPSTQVIWATTITQVLATGLALTGFLMSGKLNIFETAFVWIWAFLWMQVSELMKVVIKNNS